ncbi:MAG TPA: DolP-mannose mannosyltransferase [Blastocatellia bacterium]|nr:DolP-mannose mannosyltransferase [Blastocatellia bacterium]
MSKVVEIEEAGAAQQPRVRKLVWLDRRLLFLATVLVAAVVYYQFDLWKQPIRGDRANWEYMAQVISRGGVPYRDAVNIKGPLSAYIGAAVIAAARPFGLRDIYAVRATYFLLAVLTVGFTALVAFEYFKSYRVALLAALVMSSFNAFAITNSAGIQAKTPMILFGVVTIWLIQKDRPLLAGLFAMLSALSWQPGLLFLGAAGLAFSRYLTGWRDLKVIRLLAGAAIPLAVMLIYFWIVGALKDFYLWTIHYNLTVYAPRESRPAADFFQYIGHMVNEQYKTDRFFFYVAAAGLVFLIAQQIRLGAKAGKGYLLDQSRFHALLIAPLVYFVFCMINVQGDADFLPFLPFVSIFAAFALVTALDSALELLRRARKGASQEAIRAAAFAAVCLLVFVLNVADAFSFDRRPPTLDDQQADVREMLSHIEPGDKIFVHGSVEILVISGMTNASKYFFMDRGKDVYLANVEPGGFEGWFDRLKAERPKVVALSRFQVVEHKKDFYDWVDGEYEQHKGNAISYYLRKAQ